ncbi:MAG: hypothetical protein HUJ61_03425 [Bacilli bacterium]|nr:hypothetical protein [Bacilli bacterium]
MKVSININPEREEIVTYSQERSQEMMRLRDSICQLFVPKYLLVRRKRERYRIQQKAIIRIYRESRKLKIDTIEGSFELSISLREVGEKLGEDFIKIS